MNDYKKFREEEWRKTQDQILIALILVGGFMTVGLVGYFLLRLIRSFSSI
jgi:hypothetical protein